MLWKTRNIYEPLLNQRYSHSIRFRSFFSLGADRNRGNNRDREIMNSRRGEMGGVKTVGSSGATRAAVPVPAGVSFRPGGKNKIGQNFMANRAAATTSAPAAAAAAAPKVMLTKKNPTVAAAKSTATGGGGSEKPDITGGKISSMVKEWASGSIATKDEVSERERGGG